MKYFRSLVSKWYITIGLALIITLQSCSKDVVNKSIYSGEDLFKGIFFGKGEVNNRINDFSTDFNSFATTDEDVEAISRVQDEIMMKIHSQHPEFWTSFKKNIESGNVALVKISVEQGTKYISEALNLDTESIKDKIDATSMADIKTQLSDKTIPVKDRFDRLDTKYKTLLKTLYKVKNETVKKSNQVSVLDAELAAKNVNVHIQTAYWYYLYLAVAIAALAVFIVLLATEPGDDPGEPGDPVDMISATKNNNKDNLLREEMFANIATNLKVVNQP
jgi:hypothetical protein